MNSFNFIGNVTRDLQLRYTPNGTPTVTYVVAVDRVRIVGDQRVNDPDFFPVTTYGKQAENDAKYLGRGSPVGVSCEVHSWFNQEQRRGGFNFEAFKVDYLGKRAGSAGAASPSAPQSAAGDPADAAADAAADEWLREYDQADSTGGRGQQLA
jgi:single-strand DNA-binding protein